MKVCASVELPTPIGDTLPATVEVLVKDGSCDPPTHMFAVWSQTPPNVASSSKARVTLYPVHDLVVASHFAHLPQLPPPVPSESDKPAGLNSDGSLIAPYRLTLPVVPLCVPDLDAFALLSAFAYTRDPDGVLRALVPPMPTGPQSSIPIGGDAKTRSAHVLAESYSTQELMRYTIAVNALWRDACALGEYDPRLWAAMDAAWAVILRAIAIQTAKRDSPVAQCSS
jgi:hypothetical protein